MNFTDAYNNRRMYYIVRGSLIACMIMNFFTAYAIYKENIFYCIVCYTISVLSFGPVCFFCNDSLDKFIKQIEDADRKNKKFLDDLDRAVDKFRSDSVYNEKN